MKVKDLLEKFNKEYKRPVASIGAHREVVERIPTGVFQFDLASGGGFPKGRVSVIYGPESSMKTSLCFMAIATCQRLMPDKTAVFVDVEGHFDRSWATHFGVDCDTLGYVLPTSAEEMIDIVEKLMYADDVSVIVVDSLAAMVTTGELESSAQKAVVGNAGLAINKFYRKTGRALAARGEGFAPTLLLINQIRHKIGVMYGDPECLHADTQIPFVDGRHFTIKEIVDRKIHGKVWGFNSDTQMFSPQEILSHHYNGEAGDGDFLTLKAYGAGTRSGVFSLTASYTHKIYTERGWKKLEDITTDDRVYAPYHENTNPLVGSPESRPDHILCKVEAVGPASGRKYRNRGLYDIHVAGPNTYLAGNKDNGFVVHNTMPGGSSFKFASSLTVRVYGKDEFDKQLNPDLPAYKKVSVILKKWKVPIVARTSEMHIALQKIPQYNLKIGQSYDWNTILAYLKQLDMLVKSVAGWDLVDLSTGEITDSFKTQEELKDRIYADADYGRMVKDRIISTVLLGDHVLDPEDPV